MASGSHRQSSGVLLAMAAAVLCSAVFALCLVRALDPARWVQDAPAQHASEAAIEPRPSRGVIVKITSGEVRVERALPTMDFVLQTGESLDASIPAGPFRAEFTVPFVTGATRQAQLGAEFQGGKVMITRLGEPIISDFAGDEARVSLTTWPVNLRREHDEITILFQNDGKRPCRLRAVWQPEEANGPLSLPVTNARP